MPSFFYIVVELNYLFFSFLLLVYAILRLRKRKEKHVLYLIVAFAFLAMSVTVGILDPLLWYVAIPFNGRKSLLELISLGLYACFTIFAIAAIAKIPRTNP